MSNKQSSLSLLALGSLLWSICLLPLLSGQAQTAQFTINKPTFGSSYYAGGQLIVSWSFQAHGSPVYAIELALMNGDAQNANLVAVLSKRVDPYKYNFYWAIPPNIATGTDYFIKLTALNDDNRIAEYAFSGRFTINGSSNTTTTTVPTSTVSTASQTSSSTTGSSATITSTCSIIKSDILADINSFGISIHNTGFSASSLLALFVLANGMIVPMAFFL